ncbi:MAG: M24 family metallopeptidase [Saccharofermentanales bacterium]|jgi:Xaa-Pro aminopeptidase
MNENRLERFTTGIFTREPERRWDSVRKAMKLQAIDCIVMQNIGGALAGYVRYFIDLPANRYGTVVLFPLNAEMTVITHGSPNSNAGFSPFWTPRGIKRAITVPYVQTMNYTRTYAAEAAVKYIKDNNFKRIGFVCLDSMSASFYRYVTETIGGVEIVDATDMVDEIKAVKSPDEWAVIMETIELHDRIAAELPRFIRPGRYEYEIRSDLIKLAQGWGSEEQNIIVGSDPVKSVMFGRIFANRKIEPGDMITCLIEVSGAGGYFGEVGRIWSLGEPGRELQAAYETSRQAQKLMADMMKPGADPAQIYEAGNQFLASRGYRREERSPSMPVPTAKRLAPAAPIIIGSGQAGPS